MRELVKQLPSKILSVLCPDNVLAGDVLWRG